MTFTQDTKNTATLTADSRSANATFTQDSRGYKYLWSAAVFPWQEALPWKITGGGSEYTADLRS